MTTRSLRNTFGDPMRLRFKHLALCAALLVGCSNPAEPKGGDPATNGPTTNGPTTEPSNVDTTANEELERLRDELAELQGLDADGFVAQFDPQLKVGVSYDPVAADNLDIIQASALQLTDGELDVLGEHGLVISKHHQFPSFVYGYETLYMQDLPLYISADSILHAVHRSYDAILQMVEMNTLIPELHALLTAMRAELASGALDDYPAAVRADVDFYLAVALSLLEDEAAAPVAGGDAARVAEFVQGAMDAEGMAEVKLFDSQRLFDFSQFEPRGHYTETEELMRYFRATMWLGRVDLRIVEPNMRNELVFHRNQLEMAYAIEALIDDASAKRWALIHDTIGAFVGEPDNMILPELDALLAAVGVDDASALAGIDDQTIVDAVQKHGFGTQRISSHIMISGIHGESKPLSAIFLLFGQRYVIDSHVFSNVVYDRVQGDVKRMMPDPLDVAFGALGNDQAGVLLGGQLREYGYAPDLAAMRLLTDAHGDDYWTSNLYNLWVGALRTLSPGEEAADPTAHGLPEIAGTEAWGRRVLNTQLASWAELRHDTLLYAKQSYTSGASCEFPDAYVDPYPEFYAAIGAFAVHGLAMLEELGYGGEARVTEYFNHLQETMALLEEMAEYQRTGQPYTAEMLAFVNQAVVVHEGCGSPADAEGWYPQLFLHRLLGVEYDPTIADVHTQPTDETGNPVGKVLHVGTGMPRLMVVTAETCEGPRAYAGLASSYFEVITSDFERLNDETWGATLMTSPPDDVAWMRDLQTP